MAWILLFVGAFIGALSDNLAGIVFGGAIGYLLGHSITLGGRLRALESRLLRLEQRGDEKEQQTEVASSVGRTTPPKPRPEPEKPSPSPAAPLQLDEIVVRREPPSPPHERGVSGQAGKSAQEDPWESALGSGINQLTEAVRSFFFDGNIVVRVGIVVLFFGVAFLLKYAADHGMLSIELRLSGAAIGAMAMIAAGWRLRHKRAAYALLIQGGGIGIFYITVFAAAKLYHLLPLGLAFGLMLALVALSALLALLQDSRNLIAFGISGGFLAPILTSSGSGNHVMLFSYYLLLNGGILSIAWFRAWRELNLLGFAFTFVIGAAWGWNNYRPEHFATVEPFLVAFTLFYVIIAVLFALRQPLHLRGYVDGTLVFGVPLVGFTLQYGLVREMEFGLAYSALGLALLYVVLATALWRRLGERQMRMLTESFLALGVAFATLAIPLALDSRWTSAAWAMEGAALLWVGVRQQRLLPRLTGLLLQLAAGIAFLDNRYPMDEVLPLLNGFYTGTLLLALGGLFSSYLLQRYPQRLREFEQPLHYLLLIWGLAWWVLGGMVEIEQHLERVDEYGAALLFFSVSAAFCHLTFERLSWRAMRYPIVALLPVGLLLALQAINSYALQHPFRGWAWLSWLLLFALQYRLLWRMRADYTARLIRFGHSATLWLLLFLLTWELQWQVGQWQSGIWRSVSWAVVPLLAVTLLLMWGDKLRWPVRRYLTTYLGMTLFPLMLFLLAWFGLMVYPAGDPSPLPYLPLINPQELMQLMVILLFASWVVLHQEKGSRILGDVSPQATYYLMGGMAFVLLNEVIAHTIHHYYGVPYTLRSMHHSQLFQTTLSVVWSSVALMIMVLATRMVKRTLWLVGLGLLGLVVIKLILVDLDGSGTIARIVSFIAVGLLMLLIGYFSPIPPKGQEER
ncbi:MAG: DUF2339 domain-containing protein [Chromatiales bacterium]|nr:DUF2339 domain-containing protein [Chromatiales bacterium]